MHTVMLASVGALAVCVTLPALAAEQNALRKGHCSLWPYTWRWTGRLADSLIASAVVRAT